MLFRKAYMITSDQPTPETRRAPSYTRNRYMSRPVMIGGAGLTGLGLMSYYKNNLFRSNNTFYAALAVVAGATFLAINYDAKKAHY